MSRLPTDVVEFIKLPSDTSYSGLSRDIFRKFGIFVGKSTISYYKRSNPRIKPVDFSTIQKWELEWLFGLYFADGSKFFERGHYGYTIKFALDCERDKDIAERVIKILQKLGLKPTISIDRKVLVIRVFSKELYSVFPPKSEFYKPKDIFAFVAGLIDGDGWTRKTYSYAYIGQDSHEDVMSYLMEKLKLSKYEWKGVRWGELRRIVYYVPVSIGKTLIEKNYCVKLLRKLNKDNN